MTAPQPGGSDVPPFQLQIGWDQPELLGARWWHATLEATARPPRAGRPDRGTSDADASRRAALVKLVVIGGGLVVGGVVIANLMRTTRTPDEFLAVERDSLAVQREKGVAAGATNVAFQWPDAVSNDCAGRPLDRSSMRDLATQLQPAGVEPRKAYVPTLFQSLGDARDDSLTKSFTMVHSARMRAAFGQGEAIRELLAANLEPRSVALVVDLPGPESVAFAAGLQPTTQAVFVFDNWPHPRGVVPAHLTLAAAMYYRPLFTANTGSRADAPCVFVLDRNRLNPYQNEPDRFDNRYAAKLPGLELLRTLGVKSVIYVVPAGAPEKELDDLNAPFAAWRQGGIEVRMLGLADVQPAASERNSGAAGTAQRHYWHGNPAYHWWFWNHFGGASRPGPVPAERPPTSSFGSTWAPNRRATMFDGANRLGKTSVPQPAPRGSWGRSTSGFGG